MKYDLDALCTSALSEQAATATAWGTHPQDYERWMGVFDELVRQGCRWGYDDMWYWFEEHWPHVPDRQIRTLCAYAEMALARETSEWLDAGAALVRRVAGAAHN